MSTDNKPTVQQAAKQGNPQAIAILLNRQLQPKGITAKVSAKDSCLQIMLETANVPNQKGLVAAIQKWIDGLGIDAIQRVQIYAKQTGEDIPAWNDSFEVVRQLEEPKAHSTVNSPTVTTETPKNDVQVEEVNTSKLDSALLELAKNGDTKAISELIKNSLQQTDVKVRATLNKGLLQVVIASNQVPEQDDSVAAIPKIVTSFKSTLIQKVKVVGMQEIEGSSSSNIFWLKETVTEKIVTDTKQTEIEIQIQNDASKDVVQESKFSENKYQTPSIFNKLSRYIHPALAVIAVSLFSMGYYGWKLREQHLFMDNAEKTADYSEQLLSSWRSKTGLYGDNKEKSSENIVKTVDLAIEYEKQTKSEFSSQIIIFIFFGLLSGGMSLIYLRRNTRTNNENEIIKKFYTKFGIVNNLYFNIHPTVKISILILSLLSVGYCNWYLGRYISVIGANADNAYQEFESYKRFEATISRDYSIRDNELRQNTVISSIIEPANSAAKSLGIVVKTGTEYSFYSNIFDFFILLLISVIAASLYIEILDRATSSKSLRKELNPLRVKLQALDIFNKLYFSTHPAFKISILIVSLLSMSYYYWYLGRYILAIEMSTKTAGIEQEIYRQYPNNSNARSVALTSQNLSQRKSEYSFHVKTFDFLTLLLISMVVISLYMEVLSRANAKKLQAEYKKEYQLVKEELRKDSTNTALREKALETARLGGYDEQKIANDLSVINSKIN